jgi:hypothetical protein
MEFQALFKRKGIADSVFRSEIQIHSPLPELEARPLFPKAKLWQRSGTGYVTNSLRYLGEAPVFQ